ncbi:hypothetical protein NQ318_009488 [Aromia moschata]|uniref:Uncharacterized protein n=1 Tax=Aromia moschata TaxID=1265417 RepID=A0AAV8Z8E6_9CUCU|nr:hypothetical protein NQ318_009488 [Aromia moschata]
MLLPDRTSLECRLSRLLSNGEVISEEVRHETCRILRKSKLPKRNIKREEEKALRDIRNNQDIIVLKADKGNATVVMKKEEYQRKIESLLDPEHYRKLKKDPTLGLAFDNFLMTKRHHNLYQLDDEEGLSVMAFLDPRSSPSTGWREKIMGLGSVVSRQRNVWVKNTSLI